MRCKNQKFPAMPATGDKGATIMEYVLATVILVLGVGAFLGLSGVLSDLNDEEAGPAREFVDDGRTTFKSWNLTRES